MNLLRNLILISLLLFAFGCSFGPKSIPEEVNHALNLSGKNRKELLKVISHYQHQGDELKLKGVYFILENIVDQYHYRGDGVNRFRNTFYKMDSLLKSGNGIFNRSWDSIQALYPPPALNTVYIVEDVAILKSDYLIRHIDAAFKAWEYPWAKNLSFEEFCEYILPYKLVNEEPEQWMSVSQAKYQWVLDSIKDPENTKEACLLVNSDLKRAFYINARFDCNWDISFRDLQTTQTGKCSHATQLTSYAMRSMGIPIVMDYTPHWANKNLSHEWNALLYKGKAFHFVGSDSDPGKDKVSFTRSYWLRRKRAKIFRRMYSLQNSSLAMLEKDFKKIPREFRNRHIKDVTKEYVPVSDVEIKINGKFPEAKFVYLCVFNDQQWHPIYWGEISRFNNVVFKNMGRDIAYLPAYYESGKLVPAGNPFILTAKGDQQNIPVNITKKEQIIIKQKYPEDKSNKIFPDETYELFYWSDNWKSLGRQTANSDSLIYGKVPANTLLMIKNVNKGKQERIFLYKEGAQQWW